jgi:hypothetical protein
MKMPARRAALLITGAASFAALLCAAPSAHAQLLGGLNPNSSQPGRPTFGRSGSVGGGQQSAPVSRSFLPSRGGSVSGSSVASPFGGAYGGFAMRGFSGGDYAPESQQIYTQPHWYVRNYGNSRPEFGSQGEISDSGMTPRSINNLPDTHVNTAPTRNRPVLVRSGTTVAPTTGYVNNYSPPIVSNGPALLGGYYYGGYCDISYGDDTYPSVYGIYDGFPAYIDNIGPGLNILTPPSPLVYVDDPEPFYPPIYTVTYNQNNYYLTNEDQAGEIENGGEQAPVAVKKAYPADSYQAAFADIEKSWNNGDISLLQKHLRSNDTKISVYLKSDYKYSLASSDFTQITRDAFDRLNTVSFKFTALQKAKNGDITAYGTHIYRPENSGGDGEIVAFDPDSSPSDGDTDGEDTGNGTNKTVYVSYTLRHGDTGWYITSINSATHPLVQTEN